MVRSQLQSKCNQILIWCLIAMGAIGLIGLIRFDLFTDFNYFSSINMTEQPINHNQNISHLKSELQSTWKEIHSLTITNKQLLHDKAKIEKQIKSLKSDIENMQNQNNLNNEQKKRISNKKKIIHILGTGCVGSTYSAVTLGKHPDIFSIPQEPFNTHFHEKYRKPLYIPLLQCLFLNICDNQLVKIRLHLQNKDDIDKFKNSPILLKTTQFQRFDLLNSTIFENTSAIARHVIDEYYIVLLVRDPRATWNSCKQHDWNEADPTYLCDKFIKMMNELEILRKYYKLNIIGMYTEYISTLYPYQYRDIIYKFVGLSTKISIQKDKYRIKLENEKFGNKTKKIQHVNRWLNELNFTQIHMIQNIDSCRQWIQMFGYNFVNNTKENILLNTEQLTHSRNPYPIDL